MSVTERFMPASPPRQLPGMFDCMAADKRAINIAFVQASLYSLLAPHILLKWAFCDAYRFFWSTFASLILNLQAPRWSPAHPAQGVSYVVQTSSHPSTSFARLTFRLYPLMSETSCLQNLYRSHTHPKFHMHSNTAGTRVDPGSATPNSYYTPAAVTIISQKSLTSVTQDKNPNLWIQFINKQKEMMFKTRCTEVNFGLITTDIYHYSNSLQL